MRISEEIPLSKKKRSFVDSLSENESPIKKPSQKNDKDGEWELEITPEKIEGETKKCKLYSD